MARDKKISEIRQTNKWEEFIPDKIFVNKKRVELLKLKAKEGYPLPLVEVIKTGEKLEIIGDQDSFFASKELKIPVNYYESFRAENNQAKRQRRLLITNLELMELIT